MNLAKMMKQAQEMQSKMQEMQDGLANLEVIGEAGAGMVRVTLTGKGALKAVKIDPSLLTSEDAEVVEDLIVAAHADAKRRADEKRGEEMAAMTSGLGLPPGFKLPF